jgi:hypothetical protein
MTSDQINSALRHAYSAIGAIGAFAVAIHFAPPEMVDSATAALHQIGDGLSMTFGGVMALIPVVTAAYAAYKASPIARAIATGKLAGVKVTVDKTASPALQKIADDPSIPAVTR